MQNKLTLRELIEATGGRLITSHDRIEPAGDAELGHVVTHSSDVELGDVFWALSDRRDGRDFAADAFARGAQGVVAGPEGVEPIRGRWSLEVEDAQQALWDVAAVWRRRLSAQVVAVTGSVGKSTTRQMIHTILGSALSGFASPKNYNNHIGLPLSLLATDCDHDYGVFELGTSWPGEIDRLAQLCRPHVAVITAAADAHLGNFGSLDSLAAEKASLADAVPHDGHCVLAGDDERLSRATAHLPAEQTTRVGRGSRNDLCATQVAYCEGRLTFCVDRQPFVLSVWGRHHLTPALCAIAVGRRFGFSLEQIAAALSGFEPLPRRCAMSVEHGFRVIDDTYNASPTAARAALELLGESDAAGRRIVVTGDMLELGPHSQTMHRRLGADVVNVCGADRLVACGDHSQDVVSAARHAGMSPQHAWACDSPDEALDQLSTCLQPGDVVLVKGSRSAHLERVAQGLHGFDLRRAA